MTDYIDSIDPRKGEECGLGSIAAAAVAAAIAAAVDAAADDTAAAPAAVAATVAAAAVPAAAVGSLHSPIALAPVRRHRHAAGARPR